MSAPGSMQVSDGSKKPSALAKLGKAIKSSPKVVRKAIGKAMGGQSSGKAKDAPKKLKGARPNGWLYADEHIETGITYKVQYLGSVEVEFNPSDQDANQEAAQTAMRALREFNKEQRDKLPTMGLRIARKNITLFSVPNAGGRGGGQRVIMRQSTTRIAYSTVDSKRPKTFSYVGVVKDVNIALCHVFNCTSKKQGYEMTFVSAQAFELNFQFWQADRERAQAEATSSEKEDIHPSEAWQKKESAESVNTAIDSALSQAYEAPPAVAVAPSDPSSPTLSERSEKAFFGAQGVDDPAALAGKYFASLGVNLVEAEDEPVDDNFAQLAMARRNSVMSIGVDADLWEGGDVGVDDDGDGQGYMTVGATDALFQGASTFADDDDTDL